ncbi:hypothetical protein SVXNc_0490 [Candidatus Nanohalococcus occultus]|uniref:Uncharacterized protein n=2 Tax=Candidatus Nanohalococcus occultus TaxID=2978047 RepID=A0ABY8CGA8_9ARCH|nr:hypothetical protein SVXNc_0490 [Candidatus Nanohaloarchaeota archaeon SVXNc]
MQSESVIFGSWDNHGNKMNLRLSAQNSQKVDEDVQLVFKHGNKQIKSVEQPSDLKYIIKYTLLRDIDGFTVEKATEAIELFNKHYSDDIDPEAALKGWKVKGKILDQE